MRIAAVLVIVAALVACGSKNKAARSSAPMAPGVGSPPPPQSPDSNADADKPADSPTETKGVDPCQGGQKP